MGILAGPDIISDGLVLYLDPGNKKSYPGSGDTWFDLAGNIDSNKNGSPIFLTDHNGIWDLGVASNDYFKLESANGVRYEDSEEFTLSMWYYHTSVAGATVDRQYLWDSRPSAGDVDVYAIWIDNDQNQMESYLSGVGNHNVTRLGFNEWNQITFIFSRSGVAGTHFIKYYLNGDYISESASGTATTGSQITPGVYIGTAYATGYTLDGKLGPFIIYNKELTAKEILYNYDMQKLRFENI